MHILVFKTNLSSNNQVQSISTALNRHPDISQWNVDLQDCDKILRVVAENHIPADIENLVSAAGFLCEELI